MTTADLNRKIEKIRRQLETINFSIVSDNRKFTTSTDHPAFKLIDKAKDFLRNAQHELLSTVEPLRAEAN
jgi:hypothetical protein